MCGITENKEPILYEEEKEEIIRRLDEIQKGEAETLPVKAIYNLLKEKDSPLTTSTD